MATYAGYKAYETPDFGGMAAKAIDKLTEAQDKKDLLQQQLDYKKSLSVQKAAEKSAEKQEKKAKQEYEGLQTQALSLSKGISEVKPIKGNADLESAATDFTTNLKAETDAAIGTKDPEVIAKFQRSFPKIQSSMKIANNFFTNTSSFIEKANASKSQYLAKLGEEAFSIGAPSKNNRVEFSRDEDGNMYVNVYRPSIKPEYNPNLKVQYPKSNFRVNKDMTQDVELYSTIPISSLSNVLAEPDIPSTDFKKSEEGILNYGKLSENSAGNVDQLSSKDFQKQRDAFAIRMSNVSNPRDTYDAVYYYIPKIGKEVIPINSNATNEDIEEKIKQSGYEEKDVFVLKYKYDNGKLIPMLDEKQQKELEGAIKQSINGQAVKQVTKPNVETAEKKTKKEQENFVSLILKGDPGALLSFGNIGTQNKQLGSEDLNPPYKYENGILYVRGITNQISEPGSGKPLPIYGDYKPIDPKSPGARQEVKDILGYK